MKLHSSQLSIINRAIPFLIFLVVFFAHNNSPVAHFADSRWVLYESMSLIKEGNLNLDEYRDLIAKDDYRIKYNEGHVYSKYPIGTPILITPLVFVIDKIGKYFCKFDLERYLINTKPSPSTILPKIEVFIASFMVALTAVFTYLIARLFLNIKSSLLLVFIFAFCTQAWSVASRALWQHGPSMLMLSMSLYIALLSRTKHYLIVFLSAPLLFSVLIRPTNSISLAFLSLYVAKYYKKYLIQYLLISFLPVICFVTLTHLFSINYVLGDYPKYVNYVYLMKFKTFTMEHLFGNMISPARGLLIFIPVYLFSIAGVVIKFRSKKAEQLDIFLLGIIFFHWIAISSIKNSWWGGHSFGPRYFTDMAPYFIYFLIPFIKYLVNTRGLRKYLLTFVFSLTILASFYINFQGANNWNVWAWNVVPIDVYEKPSRLWDWHDIQFLR